MSVKFYENEKIFHITTPNSSYIFRLNGEYMLEHLYYGKKIDNLHGLKNRELFSHFTSRNYEYLEQGVALHGETIPQEYGFFGSPDMRTPSFHAKYSDGSRITKMKYVSHNIFKGKPKLQGLPATYVENENDAETLEIKVKDELTGLSLVYRYTAFSNLDVICRSVDVINEGKNDVNISSAMSMSLDLTEQDFDFVHLFGAWARERSIEKTPLCHGLMKIESRRGSSSHHHSPFFALSRKNTTEECGEVYGFSLLYSGNFEAGVEVDTYDGLRAFMGINSFDFNWLLKPGESFYTPEAVMVYSKEGFGGMSRTFHDLYRNNLERGKFKGKKRPIVINSWEATMFDFDEKIILDYAKAAKKLGIEMLVLDDGWFGKRNDDKSSLGDWEPNLEKLPNGITGLAEKVKAEGLEFGLWYEPEMISPDSDLYRKHPDWCLHVEGRGKSIGRNQLVLDLSRDDVCEYIIDFLRKGLSSAPISYIKWDFNRNATEVGSAILPPERQTEVLHRYVLNLYKILETITTEFPDVIFEGCSGGGGRFDAGMMHYFHQYWTSDDTDAVERIKIQYGTSMVMPAEFCSAHVSHAPYGRMGRYTSLKTRGNVASFGPFGYEMDIRKLSDEEAEEIKAQIERYNLIYKTIQTGDQYRLISPFEDLYAAWEYVSKDKKEVILFFATILSKPQNLPKRVKLAGLDDNALYRLRGNEEVYSGEVLMNFGISMNTLTDFDSEVLVFDKI